MNKFLDVDLIESLGAILCQNTKIYQSDFETVKKVFNKAASRSDAVDRTFLWLSRPCGTNCYRECDVFLKESYSYHAGQFYGGNDFKGVLAFAVEITGSEGIDIVPSNMSLFGTIWNLIKEETENIISRYQKFMEAVKREDGRTVENGNFKGYDYCIIDNPPDISLNAINALVVTDEVIVPVKIDEKANLRIQPLLCCSTGL